MKKDNPFHILIVDDEKFNIELAAVYLKEEGYKLSFALHGLGAVETISKNNISLILLDINMPGKDGFEVCKILKEDKKTKDIPIIFLTAQTDIEYISKAFEIGGADYIVKPFNGVELKARVKTQLQALSYLDEIKNKQSKLAQLSITDPLTKLSNSLYFDSQMQIFQKDEKNFWILYFKINNFEKINNLYGFYASNKIIKRVAKIIKECSYSNAVVAKLYGVSFGVLVKDYEKQEIKKLYEKIYIEISKDKQLENLFTFSTVMYRVKDSSLTIPTLYKQIQTRLLELEKNESNYSFIL